MAGKRETYRIVGRGRGASGGVEVREYGVMRRY